VDDDESFRESLRDLLVANQLEVLAFESADAFWAGGAEGAVHCVLVDASLLGTSGADFGRQLRQRGSSVPIIFVTGYAGDEVRHRLLAAGGADCLFKPFEEEELLAALDRVLASSSAS
jgi:FixJ family two-component response regulator